MQGAFVASFVIRPCLLSAFVFALLVAPHARGDEGPAPEEAPQAPERFLRDWVRGEARYDYFAFFHEHASDVHRADSEHFEVAVKALALRTAGSPAVRAALAKDLLRSYEADETPEAVRIRALHVLGRLAAPAALPLLVAASRALAPEIKATAIRGLGFFGDVPAEESFSVYGGRIRYVVLPAAPAARATEALREAAEALRTTPPAGRGYGRPPFRTGGYPVGLALKEALRSHRSARAADAVVACLRASESQDLLYDNDLATLLAECARKGGLVTVRQLTMEDDPYLRRLAARALGRTARRGAVAPLLTLVADEDRVVRAAAHFALTRLAGLDGAPDDASKAAWTERLGPNGERCEPRGAKKLRNLEPGIYHLGP